MSTEHEQRGPRLGFEELRQAAAEMLGMATGESIAHLNCLIHRGLATREYDAAGIAWYRKTQS